MDKKITNLTMEELSKISWDEMDEEQRNLFTSIENLRKQCLTILNDEFIDYFHDESQEYTKEILEICRGDEGQDNQRFKKSFINALCEWSLGNSKTIDEWIAWNTNTPNEEVA
jgi:hypothetical protein